MKASSHESLDREREAKLGSNRGFGLVMAGAGAVLALLALWSGRFAWTALWASAASGFALVAYAAPDRLALLNRAWFRFGLLLHRVISPVVMGLMFFGVVTPIGLLMRLFGRRPLALGFDRDAQSYWIRRTDGAFAPGSMRKQY
jgi:Saxitoxin biosynthesis operon protein SxtJ